MSTQHSVLSTQSFSHVRMLLGDISLMTGDTQSAMKSYLKEAADSPAHWYQAGQIAFRISSRGIAANPYIAEGLTGRTKINEHLYWHASNRNGPESIAMVKKIQKHYGAEIWPWEHAGFARST